MVAAKKEIENQAILFKKNLNSHLTDFQIRINRAAIELAHSKTHLVRKRDELLNMARKKFAVDGYVFKKGEVTIKDIMEILNHQNPQLQSVPNVIKA